MNKQIKLGRTGKNQLGGLYKEKQRNFWAFWKSRQEASFLRFCNIYCNSLKNRKTKHFSLFCQRLQGRQRLTDIFNLLLQKPQCSLAIQVVGGQMKNSWGVNSDQSAYLWELASCCLPLFSCAHLHPLIPNENIDEIKNCKWRQKNKLAFVGLLQVCFKHVIQWQDLIIKEDEYLTVEETVQT